MFYLRCYCNFKNLTGLAISNTIHNDGAIMAIYTSKLHTPWKNSDMPCEAVALVAQVTTSLIVIMPCHCIYHSWSACLLKLPCKLHFRSMLMMFWTSVVEHFSFHWFLNSGNQWKPSKMSKNFKIQTSWDLCHFSRNLSGRPTMKTLKFNGN